MRHWVKLATLFCCLAVSVSTFGYQGRGRGNGKGKPDPQTSKVSASVQIFTTDEVRIIREWFGSPENLRGLPPGLAKREHLPPGLQKQLVRNGKLPPGLEKKIEPLPQAVEVRLPKLPDGRRRIVISGNIILWDDKGGKILDIIASVF